MVKFLKAYINSLQYIIKSLCIHKKLNMNVTDDLFVVPQTGKIPNIHQLVNGSTVVHLVNGMSFSYKTRLDPVDTYHNVH